MANPPDANQPKWNTGPTQKLPTVPQPPSSARVASRSIQPPRQRRRTCGIVALSVVLVLFVLVGGVGLWAWNRYQTVADRIIVEVPAQFNNPDIPDEGGSQPNNGGEVPLPNTNKPRPTPNIVKDPFNVLMVGVDIRPGDTDARTDTIIVMHVDPQNKWANMISIPRDSCARIPGYNAEGECEKINAAYTYGYRDAPKQRLDPIIGGIALTRDTVEDYLGIEIDYVAQVDFNGFKKIVDTIGGININVKQPLWDPTYPSDDGDYGLIRLYIPAGYQHMDGTTALRYARSRHQGGGDYGRSQRQQDVIRAIVQALQERGLLDQIDTLNNLADQLEGTFYTDMPIKDVSNVRALAGLGSELVKGRMQSLKWPTSVDLGGPDPYTPRWAPENIEAAVDALLQGPVPDTDSGPQPTAEPTEPDAAVNVEVMNGVGLRGLAGDVATHLENRGYTINSRSDASTIYDTTVIIDYGNNKAARQQLAATLGIKSKNILTADDAPETPGSADTDIVVLLGRDYQEAWRKK